MGVAETGCCAARSNVAPVSAVVNLTGLARSQAARGKVREIRGSCSGLASGVTGEMGDEGLRPVRRAAVSQTGAMPHRPVWWRSSRDLPDRRLYVANRVRLGEALGRLSALASGVTGDTGDEGLRPLRRGAVTQPGAMPHRSVWRRSSRDLPDHGGQVADGVGFGIAYGRVARRMDGPAAALGLNMPWALQRAAVSQPERCCHPPVP